MILRKCLGFRANIIKKCILKVTTVSNISHRYGTFKGITSHTNYFNALYPSHELFPRRSYNASFLEHRKWYCNGLLDRDVSELRKERELKKITELFPEARVTLHILSQKTPDKIYDVHYKQHLPGKKAIKNQEWTCTYKLTWPEKMKFESTAISKRVAAEKAATQALHWLYTIGRIDTKGQPIFDQKVIEEIKSNIQEPIHAEISQKSMEKVEKIWTDYENGIKQIYERAAKIARLKMIEAPSHVTKDSTIDLEDDYPEGNNQLGDQLPLLSDTKPKGPIDPVYGRVLTPPTPQALKRRAEALTNSFQYYDDNITALPIDDYVSQITSTLGTSRVCVIVGAAGCGKSTRVPAALLRHCHLGGKIVVSEPRRVAAIGLAERVASEMGEEVGESIGYQVRLQSKSPRPPAGSVLYCTSGVLLNRLHSNPDLSGCSHVIIDEAHERDVNTDVTMLLLKRALQNNPHLKLVIMSATLHTDVFTEYFDNCPIIEVPGTTYPVEISYLEDIQKKYNLKLSNTSANCAKKDGKPQLNVTEITEVIKAVDKHEKEGAILVFLPGWAEIKYAKQTLDEHYKGSTLHVILPVHSRLSTGDQSRMFAPSPPGVRKIVLATNVAETSVTVPDVVHVIDAGVQRETTVTRGTGSASLETVWVSLAGAKQRCGRAGRVQPGNCYRLYTKEKEAEFVPHTTPEILRIPLEQTVLDCKTYAPEDKAVDFLSQLPQPPSLTAVSVAVKDLIDIGALTPSEQMTRLGWLLSSLSLPPRIALALIRGVIVGSALPQANIAAIHDVEVFENAADRREAIRDIKRRYSPTSDHTALHWLLSDFEEELRTTSWNDVGTWCDRYGLKKERLGYAKSLSSIYLRELLKTGLIEPHTELEDINKFADIDELNVATLFSGVDALFYTKKSVKTKGKLKTVQEVFSTSSERAHIASESVNYNISKTSTSTLLASYRGRHSAERRALMLYKTAVISPQAALLFTMGPVQKIEDNGDTAVLRMSRHKLNINIPASQSEPLLKAREMLWATFNYHIDRDIKTLEYDDITSVYRFKIRLLKAICRILVEAATGTRKTNNVEEEFG